MPASEWVYYVELTMIMRGALLGLLLLWATAAQAVDTGITIASVADIATKRAAMINDAWGISTGVLPSTMPTSVTPGVTNPFPGYNVARVDQYTFNLTNGQTNTSLFYIANNPNNNRMTFLNGGHQLTCDWTQFASHYNMQPTLKALLAAGYSVMAMNQPNCGDYNAHWALYGNSSGSPTNYGDAMLQYFYGPYNQTINYLQANQPFLDYNATGLSGGGWTSDTYPALDPRIRTSFGVAGGLPGTQFVNTGAAANSNHGDCAAPCTAEQQIPGFYSQAGYMDIYLMASQGPGRLHQQALNQGDDCCFGPTQWTSGFNFQTYYSGTAACNNAPSCTWQTYLNAYSQQVTNALATILPANNPPVYVAADSTSHQISPATLTLILSVFNSQGPPRLAGRGRVWR